MTYSAWVFEDAAHIPAFIPIAPPPLYQSRNHQEPVGARTPPAAAAAPPPSRWSQHQQQQQQPNQQQYPNQQHHQQHTQNTRLLRPFANVSAQQARRTRQPHRWFGCLARLGVNRDTGRLQWCPGCPYAKIMVMLPVALTPIVLVLVLLAQLDPVASIRQADAHHHRQHHHLQSAAVLDAALPLGVSNAIDALDAVSADDSEANRGNEPDTRSNSVERPQCTAVRFSLSETTDSEDRELLRDVRTSFIPPDYLYSSPDCVDAKVDVDVNVGSDDRDTDNFGVVDAMRDIVEDAEQRKPRRFDGRQRREAEADPKLNMTVVLESLINVVHTLNNAGHGEDAIEQIRARQADVMQQYMDATVDPCTNFYQYACGNWEQHNAIPKDKGAFDTFEMLREKLDGILRRLLSEPLSDQSAGARSSDGADKLAESQQDIEQTKPVDTEAGNSELLHRLRRRVYLRLTRHQDTPNAIRRGQHSRQRRDIESPAGDESLTTATPPRLASNESADEDMDAEDKAKLLFQTCMAYETVQERGIQPLLEFLDQLGGWPALNDDWQSEQFDWLNLTATLRQYNNDILLMLWVGADIKNSNENVIQFDQTSLGLPTRDYFLEPINAKYLAAYAQFMRTTIELLGAYTERAAAEAADIVRFETELARITSAPEARINVSLLYNKLSLGELHDQIPQIDWQHYLSVVQGRSVNANETVVMYAMDYMRNLVRLLDRTDRRTVANYLLWRFVRHRINNLDDRFQAAKQRFFYVLFGREETPERWKTCVMHVNTNMGMAVGAMFVRRYFDENSKRDTLEMTHELQQSFREILNTTEWLDAPTRHFAELKVNAMQLRIGYPDFILRRDELNARFAALRIEPGEYFENTLRVLRHIARVEQVKLGEAINRTEWNTAPAIINAYYSRNKNQILFPAGILQPPFYHRHFPRALNYGGIGVVIGHELTHGFDDKGRLYDMDGNMLRWWSDAAVDGFHKRSRCLVAQYGNYTVPDVPGVLVNGESTQGENIADNGGLKQAYRAYTQWLAAQPDAQAAERSERMPGMETMSGRQLFFLNFAQVWCGAMRPEAALNKLKTAVHSPGMYRVIGTLSNSEEFAQVYGCAAGTPMNPEQKCRVW